VFFYVKQLLYILKQALLQDKTTRQPSTNNANGSYVIHS